MRTTKRFTPAVLDLFRRQGRGIGTYTNYVPWHRVGRSDPSSRGRSHLTKSGGRYKELLSDGELTALLFAIMTMSSGDDIREQLPLSTEPDDHELMSYDLREPSESLPGTLAVARDLGLKHPITRDRDESENWVMSTDLVITYRDKAECPSLLAVSVKPSSQLTKRTKQLIQIEHAYWAARDAEFLLITPDEYDRSVQDLLFRTKPWALATAVPESQLLLAASVIVDNPGVSYTKIINTLSSQVGDDELGKQALWQAIWFGHCPIDLTRGWRPHLPLRLISMKEFIALNPVASRRSASWT